MEAVYILDRPPSCIAMFYITHFEGYIRSLSLSWTSWTTNKIV